MTTPQLITHDDTTARIDASLADLRTRGLLPGWLVPMLGRQVTQWQREGLTFSLFRLSAHFGAEQWRLLVRQSDQSGEGMGERLAGLLAADVLRRASGRG